MCKRIMDLAILSLALGVVSLLTLLPLVIFWLSAMGIQLF